MFTELKVSDTIRGMGRAGKALKQALATYGISQNQLAAVMGVGCVRDSFSDTLSKGHAARTEAWEKQEKLSGRHWRHTASARTN